MTVPADCGDEIFKNGHYLIFGVLTNLLVDFVTVGIGIVKRGLHVFPRQKRECTDNLPHSPTNLTAVLNTPYGDPSASHARVATADSNSAHDSALGERSVYDHLIAEVCTWQSSRPNLRRLNGSGHFNRSPGSTPIALAKRRSVLTLGSPLLRNCETA